MRAFSLTVVPWVIRANELVLDAKLFKQLLKQRGMIAIRGKSVCEFGTVILEHRVDKQLVVSGRATNAPLFAGEMRLYVFPNPVRNIMSSMCN